MKTTTIKITCLEDFDIIEINLPNGSQLLLKTFDRSQNKVHVTHVSRKKEKMIILPATANGIDIICSNLED